MNNHAREQLVQDIDGCQGEPNNAIPQDDRGSLRKAWRC
jgi:hypothetical protein